MLTVTVTVTVTVTYPWGGGTNLEDEIVNDATLVHCVRKIASYAIPLM